MSGPARGEGPRLYVLLNELCVELGFCLPSEEARRLVADPPTDVDAFTDAVIVAEGLDPRTFETRRRRAVRRIVARHLEPRDGPDPGR